MGGLPTEVILQFLATLPDHMRFDWPETEADGAPLEKRIQTFVEQNQLDTKVFRMMTNMNPDDVEQVLNEGINLARCRDPTAVIISRIRKIELAAGRPNAVRRYNHPPAAYSRHTEEKKPDQTPSSFRTLRIWAGGVFGWTQFMLLLLLPAALA